MGHIFKAAVTSICAYFYVNEPLGSIKSGGIS
jgi:hypothetical protein